MRAPGVFFPLLSLVLFLRCQYQECDFLSEIVNLRPCLLARGCSARNADASTACRRRRSRRADFASPGVCVRPGCDRSLPTAPPAAIELRHRPPSCGYPRGSARLPI